YAPKAAAAVPERDTERLVEAFSGVYELMPASCVLETAFNGPNLIAHIDLTLLNAGAIETAKGPYRVFNDGICRSTINLADALWQEKKRVMDALGFACGPSPAGFYRKLSDHDAHAFDGFRALEGPESLTGRYITEDVPMLDCLFLSVARAIGVATPLFEGLVAVASAVNQTDYYAQGRTLESLGIEARTPAEIVAGFRDPGNLQ
ncbi:NAD/NADP octopine/nopaline dehydrogenase family protein, partial [Anaerotruncus rubiinfantis]